VILGSGRSAFVCQIVCQICGIVSPGVCPKARRSLMAWRLVDCEDEVVEHLRRLGLHPGDDVGVDVHRERDCRVTEAL